jgi:uncharacterized protein (DUF2147 family)
MRLLQAIFTVFAFLLMAPGGAAADPATNAEANPTGEWLVAKRVARIKIVNCDERLWGYLSWEMEPGVDSNNPDREKRTRPTLGMPILIGMAQKKPNEWKGEIYNAQDGRTYSANISLINPDLLKVEGCVLGILCGGENWTRASLPASNGAAAPKGAPSQKSPPKSAAKSGAQPKADEALCLDLVRAAGPSH